MINDTMKEYSDRRTMVRLISIIVPTHNELDNVEELAARIDKVFKM